MTAPVFSIEQRLAVAKQVAKIAERDRALADHSLACGALSASLAQALELDTAEVMQAAVVGTVHEVGTIAVALESLSDLPLLSPTQYKEIERKIRCNTIALLDHDPVLRPYADLAGSLFDDLVPSMPARVVLVADIFDALTRHLPGLGNLSKRGAVDVLTSLCGARVDRRVVDALIGLLREGRTSVITA